VRFEWDDRKDAENRRKHGVSFLEAREMLCWGADRLDKFDDAHSDDEDRFVSTGPLQNGLLVVVWTERAESVIRIISARWATHQELAMYRRYMERS
jgi:uncharacterized DUF497 family protein